MPWESLFASIYLLGALFTAAVTARPIRALMGDDRPGVHADVDSATDARFIVAFMVAGVAALWPLTLAAHIVARLIPASAGDPVAEQHGVDMLGVEPLE